jgi:molybdopterin molybdotransferase
VPPGQKAKQNVRYAGEDLKAACPCCSGNAGGPAQLGVISSLGIGEVNVKRRLRVAFFSTGDELASVGTPLAKGEVYDSNRYTLHGMLSRLGVELLDLGVVRDDPAALERALRSAAASADAIVTSGGVSVGEADFVRRCWASSAKCCSGRSPCARGGRWRSAGSAKRSSSACREPGGRDGDLLPVRARGAARSRRPQRRSFARELPRPSAAALRKVPGRTEYQRGILFRDGGEWQVRITGQQGSGVLRSMAEANCFIVLEHERGALPQAR